MDLYLINYLLSEKCDHENGLPTTNDNSSEFAREFFKERLVAVLVKRLFSLHMENDNIRFQKAAFQPEITELKQEILLGNYTCKYEELITQFFERYLVNFDSIYREILESISFGKMYTVDPTGFAFIQLDRKEHNDSLWENKGDEPAFEVLGEFFKDKRLADFSKVYENVEDSVFDLIEDVYASNCDEYPDFVYFIFRSEKLGSLVENIDSIDDETLKRAINVFTGTFGDRVVNGIYWGYLLFGDDGSESYEEYPFILEPSVIAAIFVLNEKLGKEEV